MTTIRQNIRYGLRTLRGRPAFTIVATLSLALGIGANTTIFSIINATLLAPLGLENEDRLVALTTHPLEFPGNRGSAAYREFEAWQDARSFESVGALWTVPEILGGENDGTPAEDVLVIRGGPRLFEVLDVQPQIGRLITAEEDQVENWAPVALISDRFWERRFQRDPQVLGQNDPARRRRDDDHRRDAGRHRAENLRAQRGPMGALSDQCRAGDQRGRFPHECSRGSCPERRSSRRGRK